MSEIYTELINKYDKTINITESAYSLILTNDKWDAVYHLEEYLNYSSKEWGEVLELISEIDLAISSKNSPYDVYINEKYCLTIEHEEWDTHFIVEESEKENVLKKISNYFKLRYIPVKACYKENYLEILINHNYTIFGDGLGHISFYLDDENLRKEKVHYEISPVSEEFSALIQIHQMYKHIEIESEYFTTLKIYNTNNIIDLEIDDDQYEDELLYITKCILFDLSFKYSISIRVEELPEDDEDDEYLEEYDEGINEIKDPIFKAMIEI